LNNSEIHRLKEDFRKTVKELSDTYEELSLLYRLSEEFSGSGTDDICRVILRNIVYLVGVQSAGILFIDQESEKLYTKEYLGNWNDVISLHKIDNIVWESLRTKKSIAMYDVNQSLRNGQGNCFGSFLVAPMCGKKRNIGAIAIIDKMDGKEFYSGDIKLLTAIASQAALFIENVLLSEEMQFFLVGTIKSFVKALEASSCWIAGHTERVTDYALIIGKELGLDHQGMEKLKICSLLHDIGKIAIPNEILNKRGPLNRKEWLEMRRHTKVGAEILSELNGFNDVIEGILYHHEHYDGTGFYGLREKDIPIMARILAVADAVDAMTSDRPYRKRKTIDEAIRELIDESGKHFDPRVVQAFLGWIQSSHDVVFSEFKLNI